MKRRFLCIIAALLAVLLVSCSTVEVFPTLTGSDSGKTGEKTPASKTEAAMTTGVPSGAEPTSEPIKESRVSFAAVGDNIVHDAVREDAARLAGNNGSFDFVPMYSKIASAVRAADIAFVNMECPVAGASFGYSGYPYFNAPESAVDALALSGFDVFNINNNHMLDVGTAGLASTISYFKSRSDVTMIGGYNGEDDMYSPRVITVNGIKVGFVSLCYGSNIETIDPSYGVNVPIYMTKNADGSYSVNEAFISKYVSSAALSCDFLIASVHWGVEDSHTVTDEQRYVASIIADCGADAIIGHHPHVIQSVEWITRSDGSRTLVAYSLGNFISTQYYDYNMLGGMMTFDIVKDEYGAVSLDCPLFKPTMTHYSMVRDSLKVYFLEDYSDSLASLHGCSLNSDGFSYAKMISTVKYVIPAEFLSDFYR